MKDDPCRRCIPEYHEDEDAENIETNENEDNEDGEELWLWDIIWELIE